MGRYLCIVLSKLCHISRQTSLIIGREILRLSMSSLPYLCDVNLKNRERVPTLDSRKSAEFGCSSQPKHHQNLSVMSNVLNSSGTQPTREEKHLSVQQSPKSFSCSHSNQSPQSLESYTCNRHQDPCVRSKVFHHSRFDVKSSCRNHLHTDHPRSPPYVRQMVRAVFVFVVLLTLINEGHAIPNSSGFHYHERSAKNTVGMEIGNIQIGEGRRSEGRRDRRIGDHHLFKVDNWKDAREYLRKYGYLNCTDPTTLRRTADSSHSDSTNTRNLNSLVQEGSLITGRGSTGHSDPGAQTQAVCTNQSVQAAIRQLQERFHLEPTGRLDSATKQTMNKGRCGNTDTEAKLITTTKSRRTPGNFDPMEKSLANSKNNGNRYHRSHQYQHLKPMIEAVAVKNAWETLYDISGGGKWNNKLARDSRVNGKLVRNDERLDPLANLIIPPSSSSSSYGHQSHDPSLETRRQRIKAKRRLNAYLARLSAAQKRTRNKRNPSRKFQPLEGPNASKSRVKQERTVSTDNFLNPVESLVDITPSAPAFKPDLDRRKKMLEELTDKKWKEEMRRERKRQNRLARHHRRVRRRRLIQGWEGDAVEREEMDYPKAVVERLQQRRRRSIVFDGNIQEMPVESPGTRFSRDEREPVRWRLLAEGFSHKIPPAEQKAALELSFRMWSEVIPLKFVEDYSGDVKDVDILIAFAKDAHLGCDKTFDGHGGELAHSWAGGDIHFDDDENYKKFDDGELDNINLLKVAVHEVGHVLGLLHTNLEPSIMYPIYVPSAPHDDLELLRLDRDAAQKLYGVCKGTFDAVFDMVRKTRILSLTENSEGGGTERAPGTEPDGSWRYIYNTFFFRKNRYWKYENSANRTRYGDPSVMSRDWSGVPEDFDAVTQVVTRDQLSPDNYIIDTFFFKGDQYHKYLENEDKVMEGYPRLISTDFVAGQGCNETLPTTSGVDTVYFNNTDDHIYFYKGEWVWLVDARAMGGINKVATSCPIKRHFTDLYDVIGTQPLTGDVTSVYHSYNYRTTYVLKDENVYEVVTPDQMNNGQVTGMPNAVRTRLVYVAPWYNIWHDICDVD